MPFDVYTHDQINKKILAACPPAPSQNAQLCQLNGFRDDEHKVYLDKKRQFFEAVENYKRLNKDALINNKIKLDSNSLEHRWTEVNVEHSFDDTTKGFAIRKRTLRAIHDDKFDKAELCTDQAWFVRYLKLCKFVQAARTIIFKSRLLNNLRILKTWDENSVEPLEQQHKSIENVSYANLFEKFM